MGALLPAFSVGFPRLLWLRILTTLTVAKETIKDIGISATIVGDEVVYGSLD